MQKASRVKGKSLDKIVRWPLLRYAPSLSSENSHSIRIRLSGSVYRSTWNSPAGKKNYVSDLFGTWNAFFLHEWDVCERIAYHQRHFWYTSRLSCARGPSGLPITGRPRSIAANYLRVCPYRSVANG